MTNRTIHHVRHHAQKHETAHSKLKELLGRPSKREKIWHVFLVTFLITLVTIIVFINWSEITNFFTPPPEVSKEVQTHGFQSGILSNYKIDKQASDQYKKYMAQVPASGHMAGLETVQVVGNKPDEKVELSIFAENALQNSIWLTNMLSTGQHLTKLDQKTAMSLQKSMLATYYLGEKTIDIDSTLQSDSQILSQINNALSVDLFQFLNQSASRADSLNNYINLLTTLLDKADQRIADLQYKINFLQANFVSKEQQIQISEETFFENLKIFQGDDAEEELGKFIGLQEAQTEIKAKIGAYKSLQDYYKFFQPKLENLLTAIKANRDPLIAGVKVVEVQNMTLPLIIKQN